MKNLIVFAIVFLTACSPAQVVPTVTPTDTPTVTATFTSTPEPPDIEATVQSAIIQTQSAYTDTPEPTATAIKTTANNSLRIKQMYHTESKLIVIDIDAEPDWVEFAKFHARNLAISEPYHWDYYSPDKGTEWKTVYDFYKVKTGERGYEPKRKDYNPDIKMGLASFKKGEAYIYVQFWEKLENRPAVMVYYKNVVE